MATRGNTSSRRTRAAPQHSNRRHDAVQQVEDLTGTLYETDRLMHENEQLLSEYRALSRHHEPPNAALSPAEVDNLRLRNELERERLARERMELDNSKLLGALHKSLGDREGVSPRSSPPPLSVRDGLWRENTGVVQLKEEMAAVKDALLKQQAAQREQQFITSRNTQLADRLSQLEHRLTTHSNSFQDNHPTTPSKLPPRLNPLMESPPLQSATDQLIERVSQAETQLSSLLEIEKKRNGLLSAELREKDALFREVKREMRELTEKFGLAHGQSNNNLIDQFQIVITKLQKVLEEKGVLVSQIQQLEDCVQQKQENLQSTLELLQSYKARCQVIQQQLVKTQEEKERVLEKMSRLEQQCSDCELKLQQLEITNTHRQQQYKQAQELIGVAEAEKEKLLSDRLSVSENLQEQMICLKADLHQSKIAAKDLEQKYVQEISLLKQQHLAATQQLKEEHSHQLSIQRQQVTELQLQVADGQSMLRAVRIQQGKFLDEQDKLGKDLSRSQNDSEKLLRKYQKVKAHYTEKAAGLERELSEAHAEEVHRLLNQLSLAEKQTEEHERLFQCVEDEVNCLVTKMGLKPGTEVPVRRVSDPRNHIALALAKLRWLQSEAEQLREEKVLQQKQDGSKHVL